MTEISREPLRTSIASETNDHRLRKLGEGAVVIESRYDVRAILGGGAMFAALGGAACSIAWVLSVPHPLPLWLFVIFLAGAVAWVVGLGLVFPLRTTAVFDRARGIATFRGIRFGKKPTISSKDIVAVQICGPTVHSDWKSYQLNLALAAGTRDLGPQAQRTARLNLLDNGGLDELLFMGWKLAEFLDVPFLDHRAVEEAGVREGSGR